MGGWSSKVTQGTKLTPALAKAALEVLLRFEVDFNESLKAQGLLPIKIGKPVGSSAYIERDLKWRPEIEYGDIDVLLVIPRIQGLLESKNSSVYSGALKAFVGGEIRPYLMHDDQNFGNSIIVKVNKEFVQIDLVRTFADTALWASQRLKPVHGLKGALLGNLYTSVGEVLNINIGPAGVLAKEKNGKFVPYRQLKVDKTHVLSLDISAFALDIFETIAKRAKIHGFQIHEVLQLHPGMKHEIKASDLANCIKGLGRSFELNGMFGSGELTSISDYEDFIQQTKSTYRAKNIKGASDPKFLKASTPEAQTRAQATKDLLLNKSSLIEGLLD